jgi:nucleoid-associated protein YgaU
MSRYSNTKISKKSLLPKQKNDVLSYETTLYQRVPETNGDLHIISTEGDRLDNLAFQFYGDPNLWWYIAKANNLTTMNVAAGKSLVIPASVDGALGG